MKDIVLSTYLPAPPQVVCDHVLSTRLFRYVAGNLVTFNAVDPEVLPEKWLRGSYRVRMRLFGILPIGWQVIAINTPGPDDDWVVHDEGSGSAARVWDHRIFVEPDGEGTQYRDHLRIDAGMLTPIVAVFAGVFFRYRQARWRRLVENDFDYER